jgi:hypothetical protein
MQLRRIARDHRTTLHTNTLDTLLFIGTCRITAAKALAELHATKHTDIHRVPPARLLAALLAAFFTPRLLTLCHAWLTDHLPPHQETGPYPLRCPALCPLEQR